MKIINPMDFQAALYRNFNLYSRGTQDAEDIKRELITKWFNTVFLKWLTINDTAWFAKLEVKDPPSFYKSKTAGPRLVVPDRDGSELHVLIPENEWQVKDAREGLLYWVHADETSLWQGYTDNLNHIKDYLQQQLFANRPPEYEVRRHAYEHVMSASIAWHEQLEREKAKEELRQAERLKTITVDSDQDYRPITSIRINDTDLIMYRLMSPDSLEYESIRMRNCIKGYDCALYNSETVLLTVRAVSDLTKPLFDIEMSVQDYAYSQGVELSDSPLRFNVIQARGPMNEVNLDKIVNGFSKWLRDFVADISSSLVEDDKAIGYISDEKKAEIIRIRKLFGKIKEPAKKVVEQTSQETDD